MNRSLRRRIKRSSRAILGWSLCLSVASLALAQEDPKPIFVDVSDAAGIDFTHHKGATGHRYLPETMGSGGCVLDVDGDGWMDLYMVQSGSLPDDRAPGETADTPAKPAPAVSEEQRDGAPNHQLYRNRPYRNRLYRNHRDGTFEDITDTAGGGDTGYGQGAVCADYDGDGDTDIYVTNLGPNVLLRNDTGKLTDITHKAGVGDPSWSTSATFFDGDGDGDLDLYVVNYLQFTLKSHRDCRHVGSQEPIYCHPDVYPAAADTYYRNRGDGSFETHSKAAGLSTAGGKGLGVVALDFDRDGAQDLYVTNDSTPNFLYRNRGDGRFLEEGLFLGAAFNSDGKTEAGMGVDTGDVNGDGWPDLLITNLSLESNALYLGSKEGFTYATRKAGLHGPSYAVLGFGTHLADIDGDGFLDLVVVNGDVLDNIQLINDSLSWRQPGQLFRGDGQGRFRLLSATHGGAITTPRVGRGSALLDFDNDGRLDLWVSYNDDRARLFRNQAPAHHWLGVQLKDHDKNPHAIGARVTITAPDQRQSQTVRAGSSYLSSSDPRLLFGLGSSPGLVDIQVHWPDGHAQHFDEVTVDRYHVLQRQPPSSERLPRGESP